MTSMLLPLGPVTLELASEEEGFIPALEEYFIREERSGKADLTLELKIQSREGAGPVPNSLFLTKEKKEGIYETGNGLIRILPAGDGTYVLEVDPLILEGGYVRVFEQIFYQAAHTAIERKGVKAHLVHSSSVLKDGYAHIFVGKSETGKSTVARLSHAHRVLNDEISIIEQTDEGLILHGNAFNGLYRDKEPGSAPLRGIFLLRQAKFHRLTRAARGEAVKILAREIIPPVGLDALVEKDTFLIMLDRAAELCDAVSTYHMDFMKDSRFWDVIDKEFENE